MPFKLEELKDKTLRRIKTEKPLFKVTETEPKFDFGTKRGTHPAVRLLRIDANQESIHSLPEIDKEFEIAPEQPAATPKT